MKNAMSYSLGWRCTLATLAILNFQLITCPAQTPTFTYQGRLNDTNGPVTGSHNLTFRIFDAAAGGTQLWLETTNSVAISNGLFTVELGSSTPLIGPVFDGADRWLEIAVNSTTLTNRQKLTPTPYAMRALYSTTAEMATTAITVDVGAVGTSGLQNDSVTGDKISNGTITDSDVNSASFSTTFWKVDGNAGTTSGTHFVGTTDRQPLELKVNGSNAMTIDVNGRVGIGTTDPTHSLTVASVSTNALRLTGPLGAYGHGARLNFGDANYAFMEEDVDDSLRIHANRLSVTSPNSGDWTLVLPTNSVSAVEQSNEPGLSHRRQTNTELILTNTTSWSSWTTVISNSINCPDAGFVMATFSGTVSVPRLVYVYFDIAPTNVPDATGYGTEHFVNCWTNMSTVVTTHRVFPVTGPGSMSLQVLAHRTDNAAYVTVSAPILTLLYLPTAYGSVDP